MTWRTQSRGTEAVDLAPNGHPCRLNNLDNSFRGRFDYVGQLSVLKYVFSTQRDAVDHIPNSHPRKPRRLNSLGDSFLTRFTSSVTWPRRSK